VAKALEIESFLQKETEKTEKTASKWLDSRENPVEFSVFSVSFCEKRFDLMDICHARRLLQEALKFELRTRPSPSKQA
jgi:hypothetical protein